MRKKLGLLVAVLLLISIFTMILAGCNTNNTITFDSNGGDAVAAAVGKCEEEPIPSKDGFELVGWYESKSLEGEMVNFPYTVKKNTTLYAKWQEQSTQQKLGEVIDKISAAIAKSASIDATKAFGASVNLSVMGVGISLDAMVDSANIDDVKVRLGITDNGNTIANLYADDEYMYAVTDDAKKRFKDLQLADILSDVDMPDEDGFGEYLKLIDLALTLLFNSDSTTLAEVDGEYIIQNGLSGLVGLLTQVGLDLPATITDILASCDIRLNMKIVDGAVSYFALTIITPIGDVPVTSDKLIIGNDHVVEINVPSKTDATFDETYGLNFTLEGDVLFQSEKSNLSKDDVVKFNYRIHVDYNIFGMLRSALASGDIMKFDLTQIFAEPNSKIFFDIYHKCDKTCGDFCKGKEGVARGSILSFAYSPQDFGSNDINLSLNLKYLLPKGFIGSLIDLGSIDILSMFGEYIGITLDPEALFTGLGLGSTKSADASASSSSMNIVGMLMQLIGFVGDTTISQSDSEMTMNIKSLIGLINILTADMEGTSISTILDQFFGADTKWMTIGVDKAIYGDTSIASMNMYEEYMLVNTEIGEYKSFGDSFTPAKNMAWDRDEDGNVKLINGSIINYDKNGKALPLSETEIRSLLTGSAQYNYTLLNDEIGSGTAGIIDVIGLDYSKVGVAQEVTIITGMPDGGAISGLLSLVKMLMPDFTLEVPGGMFNTKITITEVEKITFAQPDKFIKDVGGVATEYDMENKYDPQMSYYTGEKLNTLYTATAIYKGGVKKELNILPTNVGTYLGNFNNYNDGTITCFIDFTLVYDAFGQTFEIPVNMADQLKVVEDTKVNLKINEQYNIKKDQKANYTNRAGEEKSDYARGKEDTMTGTCDSDSFVFDAYMTSGWFGPTWSGVKFSFTKAGTYTVKVHIAVGYYITYQVTVAPDKIVLPGYSAASSYTADDVIEINFGRTDNAGYGLNAKLAISIANTAGEIKVLADTDYELCVKDADGKLVKIDKLFLKRILVSKQTVYVRITNKDFIRDKATSTATVDVLATDFANASIVKTTTV